MESINTLEIGKRVESPLSCFNNFLLKKGQELNDIFNIDMFGTNNVIFDNESMILFNFIRFFDKNSMFAFKINAAITDMNIGIVKKVFEHKAELKSIFYQYLFIINDVTKNYDTSVAYNYIESIIDNVLNKKFNEFYVIPYKIKIFRKEWSKEKNEILHKLYSKYSYVLEINEKNYSNYVCRIIRVISSDLDESKSINNIRLLEKDYIWEQNIRKNEFRKFLIKLMYYGEFDFH